MSDVEQTLSTLQQQYEMTDLRKVDDSVDVDRLVRQAPELWDELVLVLLEVYQEKSEGLGLGAQVLDDACSFIADPTAFRQSVGWRCVVFRMEESRRWVRLLKDKARAPHVHRRARKELSKRGFLGS